MKHLKTLGLAALAVVAMTGLGVSPAAATEFHATGGTALTGVQVNSTKMNITGSELVCNIVTFTGTAAASGTSTTQSFHPAFGNCTTSGITGVINSDGCEYEFDANLNTMNLKSCTNGRITIRVNSILGNCHVDIPNQNGINNQTFINMGNTGSNTATLTWETAANNITVEVTESNGICPLTVGHHNNASYNGLIGIMGATGGTSF